jgi:hypothetical protein
VPQAVGGAAEVARIGFSSFSRSHYKTTLNLIANVIALERSVLGVFIPQHSTVVDLSTTGRGAVTEPQALARSNAGCI